jgi:hypothetical protein
MSRRSLLSIAIAVLGLLAATLTGVANSWLASNWTSALWVAVPLALVLVGAVAVLKGKEDEEKQAATAPVSATEPRNRTRMLQRVRAFWVHGVLEQSLDQVARVELGLTTLPEAVIRPLDPMVQPPDSGPRPLPAGVGIADVFDQFGQALLILGGPGAGKTTLLLELARDLLDRAERDASHPIPVVLNLSSWGVRRHSLDRWLVEELHDRYQVPRPIGGAWVRNEQLLPLLDGLDEVTPEHRAACVEAINAFRDRHGLLSLAVCSRLVDYEELGHSLLLQEAIVIQPLTREQVTAYLKQAGRPLAGVRAALRDDPQVWELLESPLLLVIVSLAYHGMPAAAVRAIGSAEERRRHLFDAYVDRMLERRGRPGTTPRAQTCRRLAWLAQAMRAHEQSVFYLEQLQPDWLPTRRQQWLATTGLAVVLGGFVAVFMFPFFSFASVLAGLLVGLFAWSPMIRPVEQISFSRTGYRRRLATRFGWGVLAGGTLSAILTLSDLLVLPEGCLSEDGLRVECPADVGTLDVSYSLLAFLVVGLTCGFLAGGLGGFLSTGISARHTVPNEGIRRSARRSILVYLTLLVVPASVFFSFTESGEFAFAAVLIQFAIAIAVILLVAAFFRRWTSRRRPRRRLPLIGRSLLLLCILFMFLYASLFGFVFLPLALSVALWAGGRAALQHLVLRLVLVRNRSAPWRLVDFLDEATDRLLLRKVGGGYVFVHRLLLEYFADLQTQGVAHTTRSTAVDATAPNRGLR